MRGILCRKRENFSKTYFDFQFLEILGKFHYFADVSHDVWSTQEHALR